VDVDIVRDTAALDALSADWTRLDAADPGAEFYARFPVVRAWWAAFGEDAAYDLEVVVARHNGAVVGILPLARQRISVRRQPRTQLRFASHGDWMGAILDPCLNPRTVCRALLAALDADPSWDILSLDNLRAGSALAATALATDRWNPHLTHRVEHPWIDLAGVAGLAAFEAAGRVPDKTRKYRGRLLRDHDVRFVVRAGDDVDMLDRLGRLHQREKDHLIADQGRTERHSWFESAQRLAHYRGIFATPGAVVTFGYERPDGELVAARSAFRHGRTLLSWTSTYHPDLRDYRLGKVLQYDILGHVLAAGEVDVFDFGAGRYPWKFEWTDRFTSSYRLRVEREVASASPTPPASPPTPVATPTSPLTTAATKEPATTPAAPAPGGLLQRLRRRGGRTALCLGNTVRRGLGGGEVWYVVRPGDELIAYGPLLESRHPDLRLVHLSCAATAPQREVVNDEVRDPLNPSNLAAAVVAELTAAAEALGVTPERIIADPTLAPSLSSRRRLVRRAMAAYPAARHRIPPAAAPELAELIRTEAHRLGVAVVTTPAPAPGTTTELGPTGWAVAAAYRHWDPDSGRYAVHRANVSRHLAERGAGPVSPSSPASPSSP